MKKLLFVFLIICSIIYIYIFTYDKKIYYLSISNNKESSNEKEIAKYLKNKKVLELYVNNFNNENYRIIDFNYLIDTNKTLTINKKNISFKNSLVKADIITITLFPPSNNFENVYKTINYRNDLITLLDKIREYSKEDIFYLGINENNNNEIIRKNIYKINNEIKEYCKNKNIIFIDFTKEYYTSIINQIEAITLKKSI